MAQFDVYKFDLTFSIGQDRASTSWYYRQLEADASDGRTIAPNLRSALVLELWTDSLKIYTSIETGMLTSRCQLYAPTKDIPDVETAAVSFGLKTGDRLSNAEAVVVTKYPTSWTPNFICRNYYPGWDETEFTGSRMQAAVQTAAQATLTTQELKVINIVAPEALSFEQVCFSQTLWKNFDPLTQEIRDVYSVTNSIRVQAVLGTQRRRRPRHNAGPAV